MLAAIVPATCSLRAAYSGVQVMNRATADESLVARIAEQFATVWNAHEMLRLEDIYAADADFVNVIGMRWKGSAQIAKMHVMLHESRMRQTTLTSQGLTVRLLAPAVAVAHDTWVLTGDPGAPGWKIGERRRGILVHVMQKDNAGAWRIAVSQNTDIQDLPNT
jgi:uncharacterized protein (TIGR02246 family)